MTNPTSGATTHAFIGNDQAELQRQYGTPDRLHTRSSFWAPSPPGESPQDIAIEALKAAKAHRILEIGCGQGQFAERVRAELEADVLATDQSQAMVDAAKARGLDAERVDADELPYPDGTFDAVVAMWMLYHVPDLDRTLDQVKRVLKPGGVLIAVTNGEAHTADLRAAAGLGPAVTQFSAENGARSLSRHFEPVEVTTTSGKAVADYATAKAYLATFAPDAAAALEPYEGTRTYTGAGAVFVAHKR